MNKLPLAMPIGPARVPAGLLSELARNATVADLHPTTLLADLAMLDLKGLEAMAGEKPEGDHWLPWTERAIRALTTRDPAWTRRMADHLVSEEAPEGAGWDQLLVDGVTLDVCAALRLNPVALAIYARMKGDMSIETCGEDDDDPSLMPVDIADGLGGGRPQPFLTTWMTLAEGITWQTTHIEMKAQLPDAIRLGARGRPLREMVSHPALDEHDIDIARWDGAFIDLDHPKAMRVIDWRPA